MFAERYLAKRYMQGKREGRAQAIAQILALLDEDKRREFECKLRRNGDLHGSS